MDGYAVKGRDTKKAKESSSVSLKVVGVIRGGDYPEFAITDNAGTKTSNPPLWFGKG